MATDHPETEKKIFLEALALAPGQRGVFLERACAGDEERRSRIEALLAASDSGTAIMPLLGGTDMARPVLGLPDAAVDMNRVGQRIGEFHLMRAIASGGLGTVYEAMQDFPRRVVALKMMRAGIASASALRRFEFEAQVLARLRHPGIAQVYEAGVHHGPTGRVPYIALEYVPAARTLTQYADSEDLDFRQRLELIAKVCDAVHHSHTKGIIHRDLKPSNILVDLSGQPKLIDFGVAQGTSSDFRLTTHRTDVSQLVGTVLYMSPEQMSGGAQDLDTRSDVYAIGTILYELLAGRQPHSLEKTTIFEAARIVREAQPARLSSIDRRLRGDMEAIVEKAMEKERNRRYSSAAELAADIRRFLNHEPIAARPASVMYQMRVFARRNRSGLSTVTTASVAFGAGFGTASLVGGTLILSSITAIAASPQMWGVLVLILSIAWVGVLLFMAIKTRRGFLSKILMYGAAVVVGFEIFWLVCTLLT